MAVFHFCFILLELSQLHCISNIFCDYCGSCYLCLFEFSDYVETEKNCSSLYAKDYKSPYRFTFISLWFNREMSILVSNWQTRFVLNNIAFVPSEKKSLFCVYFGKTLLTVLFLFLVDFYLRKFDTNSTTAVFSWFSCNRSCFV